MIYCFFTCGDYPHLTFENPVLLTNASQSVTHADADASVINCESITDVNERQDCNKAHHNYIDNRDGINYQDDHVNDALIMQNDGHFCCDDESQTISNPLERQKQLYRLQYKELSHQARQITGFEHSSPERVDTGVAMFVMLESEDPNEVGRVLTQSDRVLDWKSSLPEDEYQTKFKDYVLKTYAQAQELLIQQELELQAQQRQDYYELER